MDTPLEKLLVELMKILPPSDKVTVPASLLNKLYLEQVMLKAKLARPKTIEISSTLDAVMWAYHKDAERYRWLCSDGKLSTFTALFFNTNTQEELDAAVDAAMKANP